MNERGVLCFRLATHEQANMGAYIAGDLGLLEQRGAHAALDGKVLRTAHVDVDRSDIAGASDVASACERTESVH